MSSSGKKSEREPFPFLQTEFNERGAVFSPDGRWIAYQSDESGQNEIYIRPFPGPGAKWQVSTKGGTRPRWRGGAAWAWIMGIFSNFSVAGFCLILSIVFCF